MAAVAAKIGEGALLGMGNPLLDISTPVEKDYLTKWGLELNNAILAEEKHQPMYKELTEKYKDTVEFIAGGATQNSIRVAQWMLQEPGATSFIGCVGKDDFAEKLTSAARADGVNVQYMIQEDTPTGTCACLINEKERSLVANLSAANKYDIKHLQQADIKAVWEKAQVYYSAGFFLTVSPPSLMAVAEHSLAAKKTFCMNLSAPFIPQFFGEPLAAALPFVDILFGNESEAEAFAKANKYEDTSVKATALKIAALEKKDASKPRMVVITQGSQSTIVVTGDKVQSFDVPKLAKEDIVDSNGAGDAFVGGFLSQFLKGKSIEQCVNAGHYSARTILGVSGTVLSGKPKFE